MTPSPKTQALEALIEAHATELKLPTVKRRFRQLAAEYPCIVVRSAAELDPKTSVWLTELRPDHCVVEGVQVYAVGIACEKIRRAAQGP